MHAGAGLPLVTLALVGGALAAPVGRPPDAAVVAACVLAAGLAAAVRRLRTPAALAAVAVLACALGAVRSRAVLYPALPRDHVAHLELPLRATLVARVVAAPERRPRQTVLLVEAEEVAAGASRRAVRGRVQLTVRRPGRRWRYGDRLRVEATLRVPRNFENPGRFDWVGHLARRGVHVTAFVWDAGAVRRLARGGTGARARLERWRARLGALMTARVPPPGGALLQALVLGDQGGIPRELRDEFTRCGVVHVLSVSGLHVALVAAGAFFAARWLLARSERLLLAVPVDAAAALAALVPVALYAVLAGLGVPVLRAAVMVAAATAGRLLGRPIDPLRALAVAALVLVLAFPAAPLDLGFQLSFVSVAAIALGIRRFVPAGRPGAARRTALLVSPCALAGTAPLTAFHFGQVSLAGLVANPIVVPVFGSAVVLLGLAGALLEPVSGAAAAAAFEVAGVVLRLGVAAVGVFAALPWASVDVPMPSGATVALLYALLGGALLRGRARRLAMALAVVGLLAVGAATGAARLHAAPLRVTFLDVGQGDAAVVELRGRVLVVDAGGSATGQFDTGEAIVSPFLRYRGLLRPHALVMTHAHPDHAGGLASLLRRHAPREFWWTGVPGGGRNWRRLERAIAASDARVRILDVRSVLPGLARDVRVLHPDAPRRLSLNDTSLTLRVPAGGGLLLTGDIEAAAEARLLRRGVPLASTVLKVPHHGSRTSSTPAFLAAVRPRIAVMSVGAGNRYGLPAADVEARYRAAGACVLRTDRCGAVTVTMGRGAPELRTERPGCACPDRVRSAG